MIFSWGGSSGWTRVVGSRRSSAGHLRAGYPPALAGHRQRLRDVGLHGADAVQLDVRREVRNQVLRLANQGRDARGHVFESREVGAGLQGVEINLRDLSERVVRRRLDVGFLGAGHLPLSQRAEDGVGCREHHQRRRSAKERAAAVGGDGAVIGLDGAVVMQVSEPGDQVRQPEHLGPFESARGDLQLLRGNGDVPGPSVGQLQGGGQIDRQSHFPRPRGRQRQRGRRARRGDRTGLRQRLGGEAGPAVAGGGLAVAGATGADGMIGGNESAARSANAAWSNPPASIGTASQRVQRLAVIRTPP